MTLPTASTLFPYESLIFSSQSSAHAAEYRTSELRRGSYGWRPRLTVMINSKDYYGRNCNPHFWFRRGYLWKCEHVRMDFCRCSLHRAHYQRRRGVVVPHRARYQRRRWSGRAPRRRQCEAAPTSPPEGVFRHKRRMELVELSGRTTGRLGYTRRLQPTPSEGRQRWHYDTLSSPQPPPPALFLRDDCGPPRAVGDGHRRRFRRGRRTFPGTTGRTEQRAD